MAIEVTNPSAIAPANNASVDSDTALSGRPDNIGGSITAASTRATVSVPTATAGASSGATAMTPQLTPAAGTVVNPNGTLNFVSSRPWTPGTGMSESTQTVALLDSGGESPDSSTPTVAPSSMMPPPGSIAPTSLSTSDLPTLRRDGGHGNADGSPLTHGATAPVLVAATPSGSNVPRMVELIRSSYAPPLVAAPRLSGALSAPNAAVLQQIAGPGILWKDTLLNPAQQLSARTQQTIQQVLASRMSSLQSLSPQQRAIIANNVGGAGQLLDQGAISPADFAAIVTTLSDNTSSLPPPATATTVIPTVSMQLPPTGGGNRAEATAARERFLTETTATLNNTVNARQRQVTTNFATIAQRDPALAQRWVDDIGRTVELVREVAPYRAAVAMYQAGYEGEIVGTNGVRYTRQSINDRVADLTSQLQQAQQVLQSSDRQVEDLLRTAAQPSPASTPTASTSTSTSTSASSAISTQLATSQQQAQQAFARYQQQPGSLQQIRGALKQAADSAPAGSEVQRGHQLTEALFSSAFVQQQIAQRGPVTTAQQTAWQEWASA